MTEVFLLGAGASHGYDEKLPQEQRPPLTDYLFVAGARSGILTTQRYPNLCRHVKEKKSGVNFNDPETLKMNVEDFLSSLVKEFNDLLVIRQPFPNNEWHEEVGSIQTALGECFYCIYELLSTYSAAYQPNLNCYHRLALYCKKKKCAVITLNYDILLEAALEHEGVSYHYLPSMASQLPRLPFAKLHGSINWANFTGGSIAYANTNGDPFYTITRSIYSNIFDLASIKIGVPIGNRTNLVRSGTDYDEPALIPPFGQDKPLGKVRIYAPVWAFAETLLHEASELTIVGCAIRETDTQLCKLLAKALDRQIQMTIVSKHPDYILTRLKDVMKNVDVKNQFKSFGEYAQSLEL